MQCERVMSGWRERAKRRGSRRIRSKDSEHARRSSDRIASYARTRRGKYHDAGGCFEGFDRVGLTEAELAVWNDVAPDAITAKTLTPATAEDFAVLCRLEMEMRSVLVARRKAGWGTRGLMLAKEYRGLVQRVEAKRRAYCLAAIGKQMASGSPERPKDPFAEFDGDLDFGDPGDSVN